MQRFSEEPLTECPTCSQPVRRIISKNIGVQFKGSGFYKTDSVAKDRIRQANKARQKDNECLLDGDVANYANQAEATTKAIVENN
jgi:predicted nucleic acid-binding Zn ribbon protein